jgi:hypothetical protein
LPSVYIGHSAKTLFAECQIFDTRQRLTAVNGPLPRAVFAECLTLGKAVFAECLDVPSVLHSINQLFTKRRTLPRAVLGKVCFAECPIKSTRQSLRHSAKARIPVVIAHPTTAKLHVPRAIFVQGPRHWSSQSNLFLHEIGPQWHEHFDYNSRSAGGPCFLTKGWGRNKYNNDDQHGRDSHTGTCLCIHASRHPLLSRFVSFFF